MVSIQSIYKSKKAASPVVGVVLATALVLVVASSVTAVAFSYSDEPNQHYEEFQDLLDTADEEETIEFGVESLDVDMTDSGFSRERHRLIDWEVEVGPATGESIENVDTIVMEMEEGEYASIIKDTRAHDRMAVRVDGEEIPLTSSTTFENERDDLDEDIEPYERVILHLEDDFTHDSETEISIENTDTRTRWAAKEFIGSIEEEPVDFELKLKGDEELTIEEETNMPERA